MLPRSWSHTLLSPCLPIRLSCNGKQCDSSSKWAACGLTCKFKLCDNIQSSLNSLTHLPTCWHKQQQYMPAHTCEHAAGQRRTSCHLQSQLLRLACEQRLHPIQLTRLVALRCGCQHIDICNNYLQAARQQTWSALCSHSHSCMTSAIVISLQASCYKKSIYEPKQLTDTNNLSQGCKCNTTANKQIAVTFACQASFAFFTASCLSFISP